LAVAAGLAATATALANPTDAQSLGDYITAICSAAFRSAPAQESRFLSENVGAMTRMMTGMEIKPSGDVDQDFAAMMIPYHKGAMEMAQAELRHGHNEQVPAPTVLTAWKLAPGQKGTAGDFRHVCTRVPGQCADHEKDGGEENAAEQPHVEPSPRDFPAPGYRWAFRGALRLALDPKRHTKSEISIAR
jgi:Domain of unknown function (DUF305)